MPSSIFAIFSSDDIHSMELLSLNNGLIVAFISAESPIVIDKDLNGIEIKNSKSRNLAHSFDLLYESKELNSMTTLVFSYEVSEMLFIMGGLTGLEIIIEESPRIFKSMALRLMASLPISKVLHEKSLPLNDDLSGIPQYI